MSTLSRLAAAARKAIGWGSKLIPRQPLETPRAGPPPLPGGILDAPPIHPKVGPSKQDIEDVKLVQETYDEIQLLGLSAKYQGKEEFQRRVMDRMRLVRSSNVWGYYYEPNNTSIRNSKAGILYVTFLDAAPAGSNVRPQSPGPTYAYYDVPENIFQAFQTKAESSAGKAVWDYLRVRESMWQHRFRYTLEQVSGDYIPRKVVRAQSGELEGFAYKTRTLLPHGDPSERKLSDPRLWSAISRLGQSRSPEVKRWIDGMRSALLREKGFRRSTLAPRTYLNRARPNRATPRTGR